MWQQSDASNLFNSIYPNQDIYTRHDYDYDFGFHGVIMNYLKIFGDCDYNSVVIILTVGR